MKKTHWRSNGSSGGDSTNAGSKTTIGDIFYMSKHCDVSHCCLLIQL